MSGVLLTITVTDKPIEEITTCSKCGAELVPHQSFRNTLCCPKCQNWYIPKEEYTLQMREKEDCHENSTKSK